MGKGPMPMDAGLLESAGVWIAGAARAQVEAITGPPPLPLARRRCSARELDAGFVRIRLCTPRADAANHSAHAPGATF